MTTDIQKFRILIVLSAILCLTVLSYNILQELFFQDLEGYVKRRIYYERTLSKKLELHKGMHWKERD